MTIQRLAPLSDLFDAKYGVNLELMRLDMVPHRREGINFVSRTDGSNGVSAFVQKLPSLEPIPAGTLTVAGGGSVLATFLQPYEYYSGRDLYYLIPKRKMSERELIYYAICIKKNKFRYSYGRQANRTLRDLLVPVEVPEKFLKTKVNFPSTEPARRKPVHLDDKEWRWFRLDELFDIERGKCGSAEKLLEKGNDINYVGAKKDNNGVMYRVKRDSRYVSKGNSIVFIGDGQGSVGYSTYQPEDFIGSTTLSIGYNKHLNPFIGLFLVTLLDKERFKYSFGRKWNGEKLKGTKIKLPVDNDNQPDWKLMEDYIKSLPYSSAL
ncbi:MAG: restriction endonuclease subunit S [Candidatus Moraniibacteriota bacterium]